MSNFAFAMDFVLSQEGGFVNDPKDAGGATNIGISLRFAKSVGADPNGDGRTDALDIRGLRPAEAIALYRQHFWVPVRGDELPRAVSIAVFDMAVNQGLRTAVKCLQQTLNIAADGVVGPQTIRSVKAASAEDLLLRFLVARLKRYTATPNFDRFGNGWFARVLSLQSYLSTMNQKGA